MHVFPFPDIGRYSPPAPLRKFGNHLCDFSQKSREGFLCLLASLAKGIGDRVEIRISTRNLNRPAPATMDGNRSTYRQSRQHVDHRRLGVDVARVPGQTGPFLAEGGSGGNTSHDVSNYTGDIGSASVEGSIRLTVRGMRASSCQTSSGTFCSTTIWYGPATDRGIVSAKLARWYIAFGSAN